MDGLDLDDMVAGVNKTGEQAKKDKNAQVQLMKKIRDNHYSVTKVVIRDDPVAKTAEDLFRALAKNTYIESINLKNVKLTVKALELLAEALKTNKTLTTLILNCVCHSDGFLPVVRALESDNTTLHTLHVFQGPNKFFESSLEKMFKDRLTNKLRGRLVQLHRSQLVVLQQDDPEAGAGTDPQPGRAQRARQDAQRQRLQEARGDAGRRLGQALFRLRRKRQVRCYGLCFLCVLLTHRCAPQVRVRLRSQLGKGIGAQN